MQSAKYARTIAPLFAITIALALSACAGQKKAEQMKAATESVARIQEGVVDYATNQKTWPKHIDDLKVGGDEMPGISYAVGEGGVVAVYFADGSALPGANLIYTPTQDAQGVVTWACTSKGLDATLKPAGCSG